MAYSELIKKIDTLRTYIRSFYIYGFKTREQFFGKSMRTYDDEKRRLENYLDGYMTFRLDENGKVTFLSIDSRHTTHNPLYKIFKAKSFTAMDISLHFMLMDILADGSKKTLNQLLDEITDTYLKDFSTEILPEESSLRKKLKEYEELGLISSTKDGKTMLYYLNPMSDLSGLEDAFAFFSEIAPCGVVGSFLFDKLPVKDVEPLFTENVYYLYDKYSDGDPYDDEVYIKNFRTVLEAVHQKKSILVEYTGRFGQKKNFSCSPYKIEYSEKDDKFRVLCNKNNSILNVSRINHCELIDNNNLPEFSEEDLPCNKRSSVILEIYDDRNALERVMLSFAHFEKSAVQISENKYQLTLNYNSFDETELVIRVLSFGPMLKVLEPESFRNLIKARISKQIELMKRK